MRRSSAPVFEVNPARARVVVAAAAARGKHRSLKSQIHPDRSEWRAPGAGAGAVRVLGAVPAELRKYKSGWPATNASETGR